MFFNDVAMVIFYHSIIKTIRIIVNDKNGNVEFWDRLVKACAFVHCCGYVPSPASWPDSERCDDVQRLLGRRPL